MNGFKLPDHNLASLPSEALHLLDLIKQKKMHLYSMKSFRSFTSEKCADHKDATGLVEWVSQNEDINLISESLDHPVSLRSFIRSLAQKDDDFTKRVMVKRKPSNVMEAQRIYDQLLLQLLLDDDYSSEAQRDLQILASKYAEMFQTQAVEFFATNGPPEDYKMHPYFYANSPLKFGVSGSSPAFDGSSGVFLTSHLNASGPTLFSFETSLYYYLIKSFQLGGAISQRSSFVCFDALKTPHSLLEHLPLVFVPTDDAAGAAEFLLMMSDKMHENRDTDSNSALHASAAGAAASFKALN